LTQASRLEGFRVNQSYRINCYINPFYITVYTIVKLQITYRLKAYPICNRATLMNEMNFAEVESENSYSGGHYQFRQSDATVTPFFSMRKLRLVFNELSGSDDFEYRDFEAFKQHVLSSFAPQLELSKWQSIAARR